MNPEIAAIRVLQIILDEDEPKPLYRSFQEPKTKILFDYETQSPYATDIGLYIEIKVPTFRKIGGFDIRRLIYYENSYYLIFQTIAGTPKYAQCHQIWKDGRRLLNDPEAETALAWIFNHEAA